MKRNSFQIQKMATFFSEVIELLEHFWWLTSVYYWNSITCAKFQSWKPFKNFRLNEFRSINMYNVRNIRLWSLYQAIVTCNDMVCQFCCEFFSWNSHRDDPATFWSLNKFFYHNHHVICHLSGNYVIHVSWKPR